jgi:hypothetical protein
MSMRGERDREPGTGGGGQAADRAIDAAARDLTRGEPTRQLRAAVRRRIEQRTWWKMPIWVPVTAAAAAMVVAVVLTRNAPDAPGTSSPPPEQTVASNQPAPIAPGVSPGPLPEPTRIRPAARTTTRPAANSRSGSNGARASTDPLYPPLVIEPLVVARIAVDAASGVMPIELEPLQIEALQVQ